MFSDVRRLRTFRAVAERGSVTAAADALGYTQSAVSQQLAALEREAGVTLLERSRRPFRPTPAGEALLPHVGRLLGDLAAAQAALDDVRGARVGRVRLATFGSALSTFVPTAIRELRRAHPAVLVQVLELQTAEALAAVRGGEADLALVHFTEPLQSEELLVRELLADPLVVALPERHRLARRGEIAVADLAGEPLLLPHRGTPAGRHRVLVERLLAAAGVTPAVAYETDDIPGAQALVAAGLALVVLHRLTVTPLRAGVAVRPLAGGEGARRVAVARAPHRSDPAADALVAHLVAAARELAPATPAN